MSEEFNPAERVIRIQGGALYLQVKDRLIWLREEAPESQVRTECLRLEEGLAFFKATVTKIVDGEIKGVGEGHGSETPKGFPPGFIEKAETIAIGRALAALGYGTAAAFEEDDGASKLPDAPVQAPQQRQPAPRPNPSQNSQAPRRGPQIAPEQAQRPVAGPGQMTDAQARKLWVVAKQAGMTEADLHKEVFETYGYESIRELTKKEASDLIDALERGALGEPDAQAVMAGLPEPDEIRDWTA